MRYRDLLLIPNVRRLAAARFLTSICFYSTVIVAFETSRGLTYTGIFGMESILSLAMFAFEVPTGVWADRFGHRRLVVVGYALEFAGTLLMAFSWGFWMFALSTFLFGVGLACLSGCESAMLYEGLPEEDRETAAASAFALLSGAGSSGFFCGLAAGSFMGARNPDLAVYVTIIPFALGLLAATRLKSGDGPVAKGHQSPGAGQLLKQALDLLRTEPGMAGLSLMNSAAFGLINAMLWFNQDLMHREGIPVFWFGPITAAAMALQMGVGLFAPRADLAFGRKTALALACLIPGAAYLAAAYVSGPLAACLLVAAVIAGSAWRSPLVEAEVNSRIPDGARATTLSGLSFLGTVAGIGLNLLIGVVRDISLPAVLQMMGLGLLALMLLPPLLVRRAASS